MELQVNEIQTLEPIKFNYEELKEGLTKQVETYKNMIYTDENIKQAKVDRASLNKLAKAINDEKIRIKNIILEPYGNFENQCKELIGIVDTAVKNIDVQIKDFEKKQDDEKLELIMNIWKENIGEFETVIDFDLIFKKEWLNKTYAISKIEADIKHIVEKTKLDMGTLDSQLKDENLNKQAKVFYFKNINQSSVLSLSLQEAIRIDDMNKKLEETKKVQNVSKNENNITNNTETLTKIEENEIKNEKLLTIDFRATGTKEQLIKLKRYCDENGIKIGRIE